MLNCERAKRSFSYGVVQSEVKGGHGMERVQAVRNLREFFRDSVEESMDRHSLDADDQTACYVVDLLTLFSRSEAFFDQSENGLELRPVALVLADAVDRQPDEKNFALQRIGDVSLFVAGFLGDGLASKLVGVDYYVRMGGAAYGTLAANIRGSVRGRAIGDVFDELAAKFNAFVDVLADIRDAARTNDADILRLYEVWQTTGSARAAKILRSMGIEPTQAPTVGAPN
jgi:hypothetical protein